MKASRGFLLTDFYQLTMLKGYFEHRMQEAAVFEFFVRHLPPTRGFLMAAGLEQVLDFLVQVRPTAKELDWLQARGRFSKAFVDHLSRWRFTGDVDAMPEGTVFFPDEPILRVTAPLPEAQLVETRIINLLHVETVIASKAARCVLAASGRLLVDFGLRRAHGEEAGCLAARAAYLAGMAGSSNVMAEILYGVPSYGTMAHSFVQAYEEESRSFREFAQSNPSDVVLLLDTYDTERAARHVVEIAPLLARAGISVKGVRLDSGNLGEHARRVRSLLDAGGLSNVTIFASGSLNEWELRRLVQEKAPINGFGLGSHLVTSADAPMLDCAYKIQEYAGRPLRKRSEGKATWPGRKQVYRFFTRDGRMDHDVVSLEADSPPADGFPLLQRFMRAGKRVAPAELLSTARQRASRTLACPPISGIFKRRPLIRWK